MVNHIKCVNYLYYYRIKCYSHRSQIIEYGKWHSNVTAKHSNIKCVKLRRKKCVTIAIFSIFPPYFSWTEYVKLCVWGNTWFEFKSEQKMCMNIKKMHLNVMIWPIIVRVFRERFEMSCSQLSTVYSDTLSLAHRVRTSQRQHSNKNRTLVWFFIPFHFVYQVCMAVPFTPFNLTCSLSWVIGVCVHS